MRIKDIFTFCFVLSFPLLLIAQKVTGKLVDQNYDGLREVTVKMFIGDDIYETVSAEDGSFTFNNVTDVDDEPILEGFELSDNYPNPFNPITRFNIKIPYRSDVKINVYNSLGQKIKEEMELTLDAGNHSVDLELDGLPNGFYIARITFNKEYSIAKKMILLYGSQHLFGSKTYPTGKSPTRSNGSFIQLETVIDKIVTENTIIGEKTFTNLPIMTGEYLDLGNLVIERFCPGTPTIEYESKIYNTVQIGDQCWLKENLDVGTMIQSTAGGQLQTNNGIIEKYCYNNEEIYCNTYGGLYEWNETMKYSAQDGARGICPIGWHIPTEPDYII